MQKLIETGAETARPRKVLIYRSINQKIHKHWHGSRQARGTESEGTDGVGVTQGVEVARTLLLTLSNRS